MDKIAEWLLIIGARLDYINNGPSSIENFFAEDYQENIRKFLIASEVSHLKQSAQKESLRIRNLLIAIDEKKEKIFSKIDSYSEYVERQKEPGRDFLYQDRHLYDQLPNPTTRITKLVNDNLRKKWFRDLRPELSKYYKLTDDFLGHSKTILWKGLTQEVANRIVNLEFDNGKKLFSPDPETSEGVLKILTHEELSDDDLKDIHIRIGCKRALAAYCFFKLYEANLFPYSLAALDKLEIIYNKGTLVRQPDADLNKFRENELPDRADAQELSRFINELQPLQ